MRYGSQGEIIWLEAFGDCEVRSDDSQNKNLRTSLQDLPQWIDHSQHETHRQKNA
mgnify:CR=1 FL=1